MITFAAVVTFTEKILNGKLHFICRVWVADFIVQIFLKEFLKFGEQKTTIVLELGMTICMKWVNSLEALQITKKKLNPFFWEGGGLGMKELIDQSAIRVDGNNHSHASSLCLKKYNSWKSSLRYHIETSQWIYNTNNLFSFYVMLVVVFHTFLFKRCGKNNLFALFFTLIKMFWPDWWWITKARSFY